MKEPIQLRDFLEFSFLSDLQNSEDTLSYIVSKCKEEENRYERCLHVYKDHHDLCLTTSGKEGMYLWEDTHTLLFQNVREEKDQEELNNGIEKTVFYRIDDRGGEAQKAFEIPFFINDIKMVSKTVYAISAVFDLRYSNLPQDSDDIKKQRLQEKKDMEDYEVLDELPFYFNGAGYTNKKRNSLFLYDVEQKSCTRISEPEFQMNEFLLDNTKEKIYFYGEAFHTQMSNRQGVYVYDLKTKQTKQCLAPGTYMIHDMKLWGDDLLIAASDGKRYGLNENPKFYLIDTSGTMTKLYDFDDALGNSVGSDCRLGKTKTSMIYQNRYFFLATMFHSSILYCLDTSGTLSIVCKEEGSIDDFTIHHDIVYFIAMHEHRLQEIYSFDLNHSVKQQLSAFNESFYQKKDIRIPQKITYQQDGVDLYGWVLLPRAFDETKRYPAILDIHGGPKTVYGEVYYHEMQIWANKGYFVFFTNPRGGDGRGNEFADLRGKYGTIDYDDLMTFTDTVLKLYPAIDFKRLAVTGGSYGGFMTNWIITHTNRFAAAASQRSIANWVGFAGTSDIGDAFANDQQAGSIWSDMEKLWWHSPLRYADQCTTPTLFIHSNEDYRCPYSEGLQMYSALCLHGVETRLCMFKGENHELSRSGKPKHRIKRLEEITHWFDQHL